MPAILIALSFVLLVAQASFQVPSASAQGQPFGFEIARQLDISAAQLQSGNRWGFFPHDNNYIGLYKSNAASPLVDSFFLLRPESGSIVSSPNGIIPYRGRVLRLSPENGSVAHTFSDPGASFNTFGTAWTDQCDLNGDGRSDVVALTQTMNPAVEEPFGFDYRFVAYSGFTGSLLFNVPVNTILTSGSTSLSCLGDIDGDGRDDFASTYVRFPTTSNLSVYSGIDASLIRTVDLATLSGSSSLSFIAHNAAVVPSASSSMGQFDSDPEPEIVIGLPTAGTSSFLIPPSLDRRCEGEDGLVIVYDPSTDQVLKVFQGGEDSHLGRYPAVVSDLNADGLNEIYTSNWNNTFTEQPADIACPQEDAEFALTTLRRNLVLSGSDGDVLFEIPNGNSRLVRDLTPFDLNADGQPDFHSVAAPYLFTPDLGSDFILDGNDLRVLLAVDVSSVTETHSKQGVAAARMPTSGGEQFTFFSSYSGRLEQNDNESLLLVNELPEYPPQSCADPSLKFVAAHTGDASTVSDPLNLEEEILKIQLKLSEFSTLQFAVFRCGVPLSSSDFEIRIKGLNGDLLLSDDGLDGDELAGDGIYSVRHGLERGRHRNYRAQLLQSGELVEEVLLFVEVYPDYEFINASFSFREPGANLVEVPLWPGNNGRVVRLPAPFPIALYDFGGSTPGELSDFQRRNPLVSPRGSIAVRGVPSAAHNMNIPNVNPDSHSLSAFWDDLIIKPSSRLFSFEILKPDGVTADKFVITWEDFAHRADPTGDYTFQMVFDNESPNIELNYQSLGTSSSSNPARNARSVTIGIDRGWDRYGFAHSLNEATIFAPQSLRLIKPESFDLSGSTFNYPPPTPTPSPSQSAPPSPSPSATASPSSSPTSSASPTPSASPIQSPVPSPTVGINAEQQAALRAQLGELRALVKALPRLRRRERGQSRDYAAVRQKISQIQSAGFTAVNSVNPSAARIKLAELGFRVEKLERTRLRRRFKKQKRRALRLVRRVQNAV